MAKPVVVIPVNELNSFDLPPVCVVTGRRDGVTFRDVKFAWYPRWIAIFVLGALIIAAILAAIMTKRVKGQLPFSEEGWEKWRRRRILLGSLGAGFFVLLFAAVFAGASSDTAGLLLGVLSAASFVGLIVVAVAMPNITCTRIADGNITLQIPSEEAATAIRLHLHSGSGARVASAMPISALPVVPT